LENIDGICNFSIISVEVKRYMMPVR